MYTLTHQIRSGYLKKIFYSKMSFKDKVVLVTGATSGIGTAIAILFSKEGAKVAMVGRKEKKLRNVAAQCENQPLVLLADIVQDEEGKRIVEETVNKFGKLDVLINNPGMAKYGSILDGKTAETYDTTLNVNLRAVVNITAVAAPHLMKTKGNIINVSSVAVPYGMSKSALDHFTKGAALELAASGVRVNSINPVPVNTDFLENVGGALKAFEYFKDGVPLNRISKAEEIADLALFLASEKAVGINGSLFLRDNGSLLEIKMSEIMLNL